MTQPIVILFVVVLLVVVAYKSLLVVRQYEQVVILRLGRTGPDLVKKPGLRLCVPVIDHPIRVDMRERAADASVLAVTRDGAQVTVNCRVRWRITDPLKSVVTVLSMVAAITGVLSDTVRGEVATRSLRDLLADRQGVAEAASSRLDERLPLWGAALISVEALSAIPA